MKRFSSKLCVTLIFLVLLQTNETLGEEQGPIVYSNLGLLKGRVLKSRDGRLYHALLNIPYGKANRFENPMPVEPWEGIHNAMKMGPECAQSTWLTHQISGEEQCLSLNIYSPNLQGNYSVMVYFHGGGFTIGTANYYHADYFMDEDVVLVTVNYRLGPFGFLSTGDQVISGNFGLKDQNLALQFVANNIAKFGGNPKSVTIFGGSAGGASVTYHMISPLSKGLFSAAIAQSGSALCPWAYKKSSKFITEKFALALDCPIDSNKLLACLQEKSTSEILDGMKSLVEFGYDPFTPFSPTIEPDDVGAFLTESPDILMETGRFNKVPLLTGLVENEGILMHSALILDIPELAQELKANWLRIFPITLEYNEVYGKISQERQDDASNLIYKYYFGNKSIDLETRQELTDLYSDRLFNHCVKKMALLTAKHVPVYPYIFAASRKDFSILQFLNIKGNYGTTHADEISFLFSQTFGLAPDFEKNSIAEKLSKNFVKLWTSFANDKKPTMLWPRITSWEAISDYEIVGREPLRYMWIDEETSVKEEFFSQRMTFWDKLLKNILIEDEEKQPKEEL